MYSYTLYIQFPSDGTYLTMDECRECDRQPFGGMIEQVLPDLIAWHSLDNEENLRAAYEYAKNAGMTYGASEVYFMAGEDGDEHVINPAFMAEAGSAPAADPESTEQAEQETTKEQEENDTMMNFDMIKAEIIEDAEQQRRKTEFYINNGYLNNWPEQNRVFSDNGIEKYSTGTCWSQYKNGTISRAEAVNYAIARYNRQSSKETAKKLAQLDKIQNAPELTWCSVSVEFRRSSVWGYNPHVESRSNGGYTTGTASGCGYDKESAAIAEAWNRNDSMLKVLCTMKEKALRAGISDSSDTCTGRSNTRVIGYGAGYSAIPYFEGGVGTSEFLHIMEKAGFTVSSYYGKRENSYTFERKEEPEE